MLTGNKGEWSEVYVLLKLLGDGLLTPGDENLEKIPDVFYPIISILRTEASGDYRYSIEDEIVVIHGTSEIARITIDIFRKKARALFKAITNKKKSTTGTFSIPEIEDFMSSISCMTLKAKSSVKTDIKIIIHDRKTNQQPTLGFSIKSQLGSSSTLFNAVTASNFIYEVTGVIKDNTIETVNSLKTKRGSKYHRDVKGRIKYLLSNNYNFNFKKVEKNVFSNNLTLIDSLLPQILSEFVLRYYSGGTANLLDIVNTLEEENPLNFDTSNGHEFYTYKIKHFLTDTALGMLPSKVWNGKYDATGGYLIIKNDGEIVCYHVYDKNQFENYLLHNTKLETPSTSRHGFGDLYMEDDRYYFKLNLQIRFKK